MKKIMFIGAVGSGKTTLVQRMEGNEIKYRKTQAIEISDFIIDTPGEFVQRRQLYRALQATSSEADCIGLLQSVNENFDAFPPLFASMFSKPVIGIITKIDKAKDESSIIKAKIALENAGTSLIFNTSSYENFGIKDLLMYLQDEEEVMW